MSTCMAITSVSRSGIVEGFRNVQDAIERLFDRTLDATSMQMVHSITHKCRVILNVILEKEEKEKSGNFREERAGAILLGATAK